LLLAETKTSRLRAMHRMTRFLVLEEGWLSEQIVLQAVLDGSKWSSKRLLIVQIWRVTFISIRT
jgi:hypothetical protein